MTRSTRPRLAALVFAAAFTVASAARDPATGSGGGGRALKQLFPNLNLGTWAERAVAAQSAAAAAAVAAKPSPPPSPESPPDAPPATLADAAKDLVKNRVRDWFQKTVANVTSGVADGRGLHSFPFPLNLS
jgi:hypothetical protein